MSRAGGSHDSLTPQARLDWLRQQLAEHGWVAIGDAAVSLRASEMTIRRDLDTLEALGEARRSRGGAQALGPSPFRSRSPRNAKAKIAIAEKVLPMVPATGAIAIDSSSTMACLANILSSAQDLIVVTNGPEAFEALQGRPGIRAVLTGGERDDRTSSLVGPAAQSVASSFRYDAAFLSAAAIDAELGCLEATPEEAALLRVFAASAAKVVVGVDSSKLQANAPAVALRWNEIDVLVTELAPDSARLQAPEAAVEIV